jgi:phage baseplate assembly protein W
MLKNPQLGTDLALINAGNWLEGAETDLAITSRGDTATIDDIENVRQAIFLRLNTRKGDLWAHPSYGCGIWDILSEPMSDNFIAEALATIKAALAAEPRVRLIDITPEPLPEQRIIIFNIRYHILGDTRTDNLVWSIDVERVRASV